MSDRPWDQDELPQMFYEIAEVTEGVSALDVRDAVCAAYDAFRPDMGTAERTETYRKFLRPICQDYADGLGLSVDLVCDALVSAMQKSEPEPEPPGRRRRDRT